MGLSAGAIGLGDLLFGGAEAAAAAAPEVAAAAAPEVAGAIALPEIAVTAPALAAGAGTEAALGGGAALGGDALAGLGLGTALGITPVLAGGTSPSSVVAGEFGSLDSSGGNFGTSTKTPLNIGQVPAFAPGGPPLPLPKPIGGGTQSASPLAPGAGPANTTANPDATDITGSGGPASGSAGALDVSMIANANPDLAAAGGLTGANTSPAGGISGFFGKNAGLLSLLGLGVGGQLLGPKISQALGLNKVPGSENLTNLANTEASLAQAQQQFGTAAEQPLLTGQLPPGQQQAVANALNDAIATIKGRYASLGLSGSSMEAEAIANAQNRSTEVAAGIEQQMAQTGAQAVSGAANALGLESQIYDTILQASIQQDQQLGNAISQFAAAAGMGTALGQAKAA